MEKVLGVEMKAISIVIGSKRTKTKESEKEINVSKETIFLICSQVTLGTSPRCVEKELSPQRGLVFFVGGCICVGIMIFLAVLGAILALCLSRAQYALPTKKARPH